MLGDTVEAVAVDDDAPDAPSKPGFFAPPALADASGGLALMAGVFDLHGYSEIRPALVLAPAIAFEPYAGLALEPDGRRIVYGLAVDAERRAELGDRSVLRARHRRRARGAEGREHPRPTSDWFHARAGGGLLVSLRFRILLRLQATNFVLYAEDRYRNVQSYVGRARFVLLNRRGTSCANLS